MDKAPLSVLLNSRSLPTGAAVHGLEKWDMNNSYWTQLKWFYLEQSAFYFVSIIVGGRGLLLKDWTRPQGHGRSSRSTTELVSFLLCCSNLSRSFSHTDNVPSLLSHIPPDIVPRSRTDIDSRRTANRCESSGSKASGLCRLSWQSLWRFNELVKVFIW